MVYIFSKGLRGLDLERGQWKEGLKVGEDGTGRDRGYGPGVHFGQKLNMVGLRLVGGLQWC